MNLEEVSNGDKKKKGNVWLTAHSKDNDRNSPYESKPAISLNTLNSWLDVKNDNTEKIENLAKYCL